MIGEDAWATEIVTTWTVQVTIGSFPTQWIDHVEHGTLGRYGFERHAETHARRLRADPRWEGRGIRIVRRRVEESKVEF